jgi:hypothetical protein
MSAEGRVERLKDLAIRLESEGQLVDAHDVRNMLAHNMCLKDLIEAQAGQLEDAMRRNELWRGWVKGTLDHPADAWKGQS